MLQRALVGITIVILIALVFAIKGLDAERLSALGSILSGAGSLLAVVWFSAGLYYQSRQLDEQRKQFTKDFEFLRNASAREAILATTSVSKYVEELKFNVMGVFIGPESIYDELVLDKKGTKRALEKSTDSSEVINAFYCRSALYNAAKLYLMELRRISEIFLSAQGNDIENSNEDIEIFVISHVNSLERVVPIAHLVKDAALIAEAVREFNEFHNEYHLAYSSAELSDEERLLAQRDPIEKKTQLIQQIESLLSKIPREKNERLPAAFMRIKKQFNL